MALCGDGRRGGSSEATAGGDTDLADFVLLEQEDLTRADGRHSLVGDEVRKRRVAAVAGQHERHLCNKKKA